MWESQCQHDRTWDILGKLNPADVTTKALDKAVTVAHSGVISGQAPIPIPKGCKVWHGPIDKPREIVGI